METYRRVRRIVAEAMNMPIVMVTPETEIAVPSDLARVDLCEESSLNFVELIMALEEEFGEELPEDPLLNEGQSLTVQQIVDLIERRRF